MEVQKKFVGVLIAGLCSGPVLADDLLGLLAEAKLADPVYSGAGFEREASEEGVTQARARLFPSASFSWEEKETDQDIKETDNNVFASGKASFDTSTYSLSLSQSVFDYERWIRLSQSKVTLSRFDERLEQAIQDLLLRLSERYFEQLKTREQLAAVAAEKEALQQHLEYAEKALKAGLGRPAEVYDAEARYLAAVAREIEFEKAYSDAQYNLKEIIGRAPGTLAPIKDDVPLLNPDPMSVEEWISRGLDSNPDVRIQLKAVEEAEYEIKAQRGGHFPTFTLTYDDFREDTDGSLFGGGSDVDTEELALRFEVPIYQGGAVNSRRREAEKQMLKAQEDLELARRSVENQAQSSYRGVVANIAQIEALKKTVDAQKSVLETRQKGFQSGIYSFIRVLDAQNDLAAAQQAYAEARNDYAINYIRLKRAAGILVEEDLRAVNSWLDQI